MKRLGSVCCFLITILLCWITLASAGTVTLEWDSVPAGVDGYKVYTMPVGEQPITTPPRTPALTVPYSSNVKTTATVTVPAGAHSFFVTSYNGWGESTPSNIVSTPPLPTTPAGVRVVVTIEVQTP